jgi:hypothetical protein
MPDSRVAGAESATNGRRMTRQSLAKDFTGSLSDGDREKAIGLLRVSFEKVDDQSLELSKYRTSDAVLLGFSSQRTRHLKPIRRRCIMERGPGGLLALGLLSAPVAEREH